MKTTFSTCKFAEGKVTHPPWPSLTDVILDSEIFGDAVTNEPHYFGSALTRQFNHTQDWRFYAFSSITRRQRIASMALAFSAASFLLLSARQLRPDEGAADEDGTEFLGKSAR
jgi:hypothetical protein